MFIWECIGGEAGLLNNSVFLGQLQQETFDDDAEKKDKNEINRYEVQIKCKLCNPAEKGTFDKT